MTISFYFENYTSSATNKSPSRQSSASTKTEFITCPGITFTNIKSQKELEDESIKRRKEEKLRLKLNRKMMFTKKGR